MEGEEECVGRGEGRRDGGRVKRWEEQMWVKVCVVKMLAGGRELREREAVSGTARVPYSTADSSTEWPAE